MTYFYCSFAKTGATWLRMHCSPNDSIINEVPIRSYNSSKNSVSDVNAIDFGILIQQNLENKLFKFVG